MEIKFRDYRKGDIEANLRRIGIRPLDVMVTGATGAGKSTTLNALFQKSVAKVGAGTDPETMELDSYELNDCFRVWDSPGLGDGVEADRSHKKKLIDLLYKTYESKGKLYGFIDLVVVVIEGCNRDMGTAYTLLNEIIVPNFQRNRILVIINQADAAMKGRHWNYDTNMPEQCLIKFLDDQALSVQKRVREATGVEIPRPVYYSAEYGYHVKAVYDFIIDYMPTCKRELK